MPPIRRCIGFFIFVLVAIAPFPLRATVFSPPGLYDAEYVVLENGLGVVLNVQKSSHEVAIRLVVETGTYDYPPGKRELPHFLEHLIFAGTKQHTEEELEELISSYGGEWNAETNAFTTVYKIDVYSGYALEALDLLYKMITGSTFAPEKVEKAREIVYREMGGKPSKIREWLYSTFGIGKDAYSRAIEELYPGGPFSFDIMETAEGITRDEILEAYRDNYVPEKMTLIVVGEFRKKGLTEVIERTFGKMKRRGVSERRIPVPDYPKGKVVVRGTFAPVLDSEASVGMAFRTDGTASADYHPLWLLERFIDKRVYEVLRIEHGLAYSPSADFYPYESFGSFWIMADVDVGNIEEALGLMRRVLEEVISGDVSPREIEKAKRDLLLTMARAYETNSEKADYYADVFYEFKKRGSLLNDEEILEKVTVDDVLRVAGKYLDPDRSVIVVSRPAMTYTGLMWAVVSFVFVALVALAFFLRKRAVRRRGLDIDHILS